MASAPNHAVDDETVSLGPLRLSALRYQFPEAEDYWDANWLIMHIRCTDDLRCASLTDPCLLVPELRDLSQSLSALVKGAARASLEAMEPYFGLTLRRDDDDVITVDARIWEKQAREPSRFVFDVSLMEVGKASAQLDALLRRYPVRGKADVH